MKTNSFLTALILAGGLAVGASAFAQQPSGDKPAPAKPVTVQPTEKKVEKKADEKKVESKGVKVGDVAPAFSLTDTDGKTVTLESFKGKVVVLEWFNPGCPIVQGHAKKGTYTKLYNEFNPKGVVFLAINSSAKDNAEGGGKEKNAKAKTDWKMSYPILLDESGDVGHAYGAKTTPHYFIVGKDGKVAYTGAIDDKADKNYVKGALEYILEGKTPDPASTSPYGCSVKYAASK